MKKVGKDGVITVEEAQTMVTELVTVEGMQFDHGYQAAYFGDRPCADGGGARRSIHSDPREEDLQHEGYPPAARAVTTIIDGAGEAKAHNAFIHGGACSVQRVFDAN
jgi:hypothetical protein